jgi:hypothetical protein
MSLLLQSTIFNKMFVLVSSTDHVSLVTGAQPVALISQNGLSFVTPEGTISEVGYGWYMIAYTASDTNILGTLALHVTALGCDDFDSVDQIIPTVAMW